MLDTETKRRIDTARDILVGKVPDPKSQVEQITIALIYKFMDDMDAEAEELGGERKFFKGDFIKYGWSKLMSPAMGGFEVLNLYAEAITKMTENEGIPVLFRDIFKNAYLPYRDPETLKSFLKIIDDFEYDHSERLGDAFEYLLSVLGSQGDAGQFRTPRHIIDFMVAVIDPKKDESVLDPACGTAGFLISSWKHVLQANSKEGRKGAGLTPDERNRLTKNIKGYDISPDMVRLSLVNLYLHGFTDPHISEYDTLTSEDNWNQYSDIILANPPFMSPKGGIKPHKRFSIQAKRSEVLFVDYITEHLTPNGRAAVIVPEGIIFQSQNAYKQLRKMLVENYLYAVVSLPAGVFQPYSGVKTSILLMDKTRAKRRDAILFVKIENDGFSLGAQRRKIDKNDLPTASEVLKSWKNSPSEKGWQAKPDGVVKWHELPYNPKLKERARELRKAGNLSEVLFWQQVKSKKFMSLDFDRQKIIGNYIVDFYCKNLAVVIEIDGSSHDDKQDYDQIRDAFLKNLGLKVIHIRDSEVKENIQGVFEFLRGELGTPRPSGTPLGEGNLWHVVSKAKIGENGEWNLSGERYRESDELHVGNYELVELGGICDFQYGKPLKKDDRVPGEYPVYGSNGIVGYHHDYLVEAPFIIVGRKGSAGEVTYSKHSGYPIDTTFYIKFQNEENITLKYLYHLLKDDLLKNLNTQAGVPGLNRNDAYKVKIPLPPLKIQQEIVAEIEGYQKIIDGARAVVENYKPQIQIDSEWETVKLGDVLNGKPKNGYSGSPVHYETNLKVLSLSATTSGSLDANKFKYLDEIIPENAECRCRKGDIYLQRGNTSELVGTAALFDLGSSDYIYPDLMIRIRAKEEKITTKYLLHVLQSLSVRQFITTNAVGAAGSMPKINQGIVLRIPIPLPAIEAQTKIVTQIEKEQALVNANKELITLFEQKIKDKIASVWGE